MLRGLTLAAVAAGAAGQSPLPAKCGGTPLKPHVNCKTDPKGADCCPFAGGVQQKCFAETEFWAACRDSCDPTWVDPYDGKKWDCTCLSSAAQCAGTTPPPAPPPLPATCAGAPLKPHVNCKTDPKGPDCCPFVGGVQQKCFAETEFWAACNDTCDPTRVDPYDGKKWDCTCLSSPALCGGTAVPTRPAPPPPVTPQPAGVRYHCNSATSQCTAQSTGHSTMDKCKAACSAGGARAWSGLVEGFYWSPKDAVHKHSGAYTAEQRVQALELLAAGGLHTYVYAPQLVDLIALLDAGEQAEWKATFARAEALGVRLVYGIRPHDHLNATLAASVMAKVAQLASLGCRAYALCIDDVPDGATPAQEQLQVDLAASLQKAHPAMEAAFLPGSYSGAPGAQEKALALLDAGLDASVAMLLTGTAIVPGSVSLADFPKLPSGRRIVFYDNWAAVDTSKRIPWDMGRPDRLPAALFGNGDKWGYVLNPSFPLERDIHQIARLAQLRADGSGAPAPQSAAAIAPAAEAWAGWLVQHGFADAASQDVVRAALDTAITRNERFESIAEVESAYPDLRGVF